MGTLGKLLEFRHYALARLGILTSAGMLMTIEPPCSIKLLFYIVKVYVVTILLTYEFVATLPLPRAALVA